MNERIKELIEKATTEEHDGFRYFDKKRFAELIVQECAHIAWLNSTQDNISHTKIKQHFGVV